MTDPLFRAVVEAAAGRDVPVQRLAMSYRVFSTLLLSLPLSLAEAVDFGITSDTHLGALHRAIRAEGETREAEEIVVGLAQRLGDGPALTAWVQSFWPDAPAFVTVYDGMPDDEGWSCDDERPPHP